VDLADDRRRGLEERHEGLDVARHHGVVDQRVPGPARVVVGGHDGGIQRRAGGRRRGRVSPAEPLGRVDEVIAAAEALAVARQQDHVHVGIEVGALHARRQLVDQPPRQAVAALRAVQRDAGDPVAGLIGHRLHGRLLPVRAGIDQEVIRPVT
jgi:hypothetical protein